MKQQKPCATCLAPLESDKTTEWRIQGKKMRLCQLCIEAVKTSGEALKQRIAVYRPIHEYIYFDEGKQIIHRAAQEHLRKFRAQAIPSPEDFELLAQTFFIGARDVSIEEILISMGR